MALIPRGVKKAAAARIDRHHRVAWESCSRSDESATLLWLNAPYDNGCQGDYIF
jgi:hypothetical protein